MLLRRRAVKDKIYSILSSLLIFPLIVGFSWLAGSSDSVSDKQEKKSQMTDQTYASSKVPSKASYKRETAKPENRNTASLEAAPGKASPGVQAPEIEPSSASRNAPPTSLKSLQNISRTLKTIGPASDAGSVQGVKQGIKSANAAFNKEPLEILKLQKQINEILETNERLKRQQESQLDQIKKISEQSVIHRKMLEDLERKKSSKAEEIPASSVDEILRQEKMRVIQQETEKNKEYVNKISAQEGPASEVT